MSDKPRPEDAYMITGEWKPGELGPLGHEPPTIVVKMALPPNRYTARDVVASSLFCALAGLVVGFLLAGVR